MYAHSEGRYYFVNVHTHTHMFVLGDGVNFISYYESQLKQFKSYWFGTGGQQMPVLGNKVYWNTA